MLCHSRFNEESEKRIDEMTDIQMAKSVLEEEDLTMVVVKNKKVIFKSKDKGIRPMYILATELKNEAENGALADRVIGKGAAILCGYIGIKYVYTDLISQGGIDTLDKYSIPFTTKKSCPYIMNRDKTDYCPIEKLSLVTEEPVILLEKVEEFFKSINM